MSYPQPATYPQSHPHAGSLPATRNYPHPLKGGAGYLRVSGGELGDCARSPVSPLTSHRTGRTNARPAPGRMSGTPVPPAPPLYQGSKRSGASWVRAGAAQNHDRIKKTISFPL